MKEKSCLTCGINVPQTPGKKERLYCSSKCLQKDWYRKRKEALKRLTGSGGMLLPADYMNIKKVGRINHDGTVTELETPIPGSFTLNDFQELSQVWDKNVQLPAMPIEKGLLKPSKSQKPKKQGKVHPKDETPVNPPENGLKIEYDGPPLTEDEVKQLAVNAKNYKKDGEKAKEFIEDYNNTPPEGLTEIQLMVWKNEQKKKTQVKKPPITNFGVGQKEKENKDPF